MTGTSLTITRADWGSDDYELHDDYESYFQERGKKFIKLFASIPPSVTSLILKDLSWYPRSRFVEQAWASIPPNVNSIVLRPEYYIDEILNWFSFLPSTIVSLDLAHLSFEGYVDPVFSDYIAKIPSSIKSLNLSDMGLGTYSVDQVKECFTLLPPGLNSLNLAGNKFHTWTSEELVSIFSAIPATVTFLNLIGGI